MGLIRFLAGGFERTVAHDGTGEPQTLLAIARQAAVPLLFNCETGDCGACLVQVETLAAGARPVAPPTEPERFLLSASGHLTQADIARADAGGRPVASRLACQYRVGDERIVVSFGSRLAG